MRGHDLLSARRARVTGAGRGIGLAIVRALHRESARIAVTARDLDDARSAAEELGREARAFRLRVTDTRETERVFRSAAEWLAGSIWSSPMP